VWAGGGIFRGGAESESAIEELLVNLGSGVKKEGDEACKANSGKWERKSDGVGWR